MVSVSAWLKHCESVYEEKKMITDLFSFGLGVATGLVLVQLYPPSARVGVWIVNKWKELLEKIKG